MMAMMPEVLASSKMLDETKLKPPMDQRVVLGAIVTALPVPLIPNELFVVAVPDRPTNEPVGAAKPVVLTVVGAMMLIVPVCVRSSTVDVNWELKLILPVIGAAKLAAVMERQIPVRVRSF